MRRGFAAVLVALLLAVPQPPRGEAQGAPSWLDQRPLPAWNTPGMAIPPAPPWDWPDSGPCHERRDQLTRPPETAEERAVAAAGWYLFDEYRGGWGVRLVRGFVDQDLNCQPVTYVTSVFVEGTFAGTTAPLPSRHKTEGMELDVALWRPNGTFESALVASFGRYDAGDMACCPSRATRVVFEIRRSPDGPLLVPNERLIRTAPTG